MHIRRIEEQQHGRLPRVMRTSYYVWWFPGSPVKVHLLLDVVRRLREELRFDRPEATGEGLLFGKVIEGATEVLDFQSATGRVHEAVASLAEDESKQLLVGYYRIETGDSLRLNDERSVARPDLLPKAIPYIPDHSANRIRPSQCKFLLSR